MAAVAAQNANAILRPLFREAIKVLKKTDISDLDMANQIMKIVRKMAKGADESVDDALERLHNHVRREMLEEKFNQLQEYFIGLDDPVIDCEGSEAPDATEMDRAGNDGGDNGTDDVGNCDDCCEECCEICCWFLC